MSWRKWLSSAAILGALIVSPGAAMAGPDNLKALEDAIFGTSLEGPTKVGEEINYSLRSPAVRMNKSKPADEPALAWTQEIRYPGASYIAPHFSKFNLPKGAALIVRSPDGRRSWKFSGTGKGNLGITEGFWGIHIPGEVAILELWSDGPVAAGAVEVDRFAHGLEELFEPGNNKALCGADDSEWAKCLQTRESTVYDKSRAVARLLINGSGACTGWLVGDGGYLLTNEHCIGTAS
ncbi:MAG TPA: gliding motility protein, partial [Thermoanaerobaculia bacterium]